MTSSDSAAAGDLVVYPPRKKLILPIGIFAVFTAISVQMVTRPTTTFHFQSKGVVVAVGWIGLIFSGLGGLALVLRALSPRPTLLIDQKGVTNRTSRASVPFLPWSEITGTRLTTAEGRDVLVLEVSDPDRFVAACKSPLRRALMQKSVQEGWGVSSILDMAVPGPLSDLKRRIDVFANKR